MSKIILKIGPGTKKVEKETINEISFGNNPLTTIKWSTDKTVVFFDRNPYYAVITQEDDVKGICDLLERHVEAKKEGNTDYSDKFMAMAAMNIEAVLSAYISRTLFEDFSEATINALRNAKSVGARNERKRNQ